MKQDKSRPKQTGSLRKQAEKALVAKSGKIREKPAEDMEKIVHELQVHQIELEMQNDELSKAQGEIEESRTKYFELYDLAPVGYFTLNQKGIIKEANLSGSKLLNTPKSVLLLKPFFLFVLPESRDAFYTHLKKVFDTGAKQTCELKLIGKNGPLSVLLESIAVPGEGANFSQCLLMVRDITKQKQAETALKESESRYHSLFANMISGFAYHKIVLNKNGTPVDYIFLEINDAFEKLTGLKREEIIGKRVSEIIPGIKDDPADWIETYGKVALTGKDTTFENYSDALKKWFTVSAYSPQKGYFVAVFDDITERKQAEEKLNRENQEITLANRILEVFVKEAGDDLYDKVLDIILKETASTHGVFGYIAEPGHLICPSLSKMLDECEVEGKCIHYPPDKWKGLWARALREKRSLYTNKPSPVPRGHPLIHNNLAVPILFQGEAIGLLNLANKKGGYTETDRETLEGISERIAPVLYAQIQRELLEKERKRGEDALQKANDELENRVGERTEELRKAHQADHFITQLLELFAKKTSRKSYLDAVVLLLHDWTGCRSVGIRVVNKERSMPYDSYRGFSEEFMRKENMISLDSDACACIRVINGKFEPQDAFAITPSGSFRLEDSIQFANQLTQKELARFRGNCIRSGYASIAVIPVRYHNQPLGAIHLADEKKNMVPSDAVQFLESLAAPLIGEAIYRFSAEEELTEHRHRLEEMVEGRTRELHEIQTDLNRAQAVAHTGSWRLDVRKNELLWSDENWRIFGVPKGTALTYETFLSIIHPDDLEYVDKQWKAALQGEPYDIEHRLVVDGQVKWVREKAELEFDKDGNLKGGFGTTQDITEKKQAERDLQTLMEELKRSNSDLEQFAYAASHDLQEPLRVVAGFVSLLEKKYNEKLDDKAHEYIEYSIDGVKRMQVLIKDLLAYSQVGTKGKTFTPTICSVALEQAIYNLNTAIEESGAEIIYDSLPTVSADTSQLIRLFQNLIGNAIKFRAEKHLKIHITAERKGNEWVFSIRDNGIGIDPKFFDRIFVVFQRLHTREEYEGTGIGLAVCKKIVERHGGHMWVESEQGKGTTFYFTMPAME